MRVRVAPPHARQAVERGEWKSGGLCRDTPRGARGTRQVGGGVALTVDEFLAQSLAFFVLLLRGGWAYGGPAADS